MKALLVVAAAALGLAACDRCDGAKKPAANPAARPERDSPATPAARNAPDREHEPTPMPGKVRLNAPLDADEATALLPPLAGAPLGAPTVAANGSQVRFPYCLGGTTLEIAGQRAEQSLRDAGWEHITSHPPDGDAPTPRVGIAADHADVRLSLTIEASGRPDCNAVNGKYYATAVMNRVAAPTTTP